jgi:hypothetical protein
MNRGFVILAFGDQKYKKCADTLARSIYRTMPDSNVSLITDLGIESNLYENVIRVKSVDSREWALGNDYLVYAHSPYEHTIKLESDLYIPCSINYWWDVLANRDLNISTTIRNFRGDVSDNDFYRQTFVRSNLPNVYNAITYFKKGELASRFYGIVRDIFENWDEYRLLLDYSTEDEATTDVVYAIAAQIIGIENCTLPSFTDFSMSHMKSEINGNKSRRWYEEMVYEIYPDCFRINTFVQQYPIHYHNKEFCETIDMELGDE